MTLDVQARVMIENSFYAKLRNQNQCNPIENEKIMWTPLDYDSGISCLYIYLVLYYTYTKEVPVRRSSNFWTNGINISIQNLLRWARGGTALVQSLLCDRNTIGQNSLRYIATSSKALVKLHWNWFNLKGFIKRTAWCRHFRYNQMSRRI